MTGKRLCSLMRFSKVTIRQLKKRTGFTLKRIREVRAAGIYDANICRDWIEAITGNDPGHDLAEYYAQQRG